MGMRNPSLVRGSIASGLVTSQGYSWAESVAPFREHDFRKIGREECEPNDSALLQDWTFSFLISLKN